MYVDIEPIESKYRGLERVLTTDILPNEKKEFEVYLEMYFEYIRVSDVEYNGDCFDTFEKILPFYKALKQKKCKCEMILFSETKVDNFLAYEVSYLGIDIVNQYAESLLLDKHIDNKYLNENGLLNNLKYAVDIVNTVGKHWTEIKKCEYWYVYQILV